MHPLASLPLLLLLPGALAETPILGYTRSPTSAVPGRAFTRFVSIWLENTDFDKAFGDPNLQWLSTHGVVLKNYFAVTHPSEPNYLASVSGEYFGVNNDDPNTVPSNVSTVADLLEDKGVTWGLYEEDMPYSGFTGKEWKNPETKANMYVRKHNPLVMYGSVADDPERLALIKNLTYFDLDLSAKQLPQWLFITPNMTSDGHDTSVTVAGAWTRSFLEPLLSNEYFMNGTLILVTFDENHSYTKQNRVFAVLLGGAVPQELRGTSDDGFYTHYSSLATVQANWGLHTLGRHDAGANVFALVARETNDTVRPLQTLGATYLNESYPGIFNNKKYAPMPRPNTEIVVNGRTVLPAVAEMWGAAGVESGYTGAVEVPGVEGSVGGTSTTVVLGPTQTAPVRGGATETRPSLAGRVAIGEVLGATVGAVWLGVMGVAGL